MQIGTIAKTMGLTVDAIRFYERNGLLPHPPRTPGGFRQYDQHDLEILAFILRLRRLGFALNEVRELLDLLRGTVQPSAFVSRRLEEELSKVRLKVADLRKLELELRRALRSDNPEGYKRCGRR
jgi:MerR family mercuric resistance operon transcriptional regulator